MSSDKKPPSKKFIADLTDDDLYAEKPPVRDDVDAKVADASDVDDKPTIQADTSAVTDKPTIQADTPADADNARRKTFHSKHFTKDIDDDSHAEDKPEGKRKISHAEASGILISVVMLGYSLVTEDKPLFFLSTALLIFLLRPIIGGLFGKHSQNVQNGLHAFSIALFVGSLVFLFF